MSKIQLTNFQKQKLWSLACALTQGEYGVWYDEDHEFDEERQLFIKIVEDTLNEKG